MLKPIIVFAQDANDARVRKRIQAFQDFGGEVIGFSFRRGSFGAEKQPFWQNIDLGETFDRQYLQRIFSLFKAFYIIWKHRNLLQNATSLYAINIDNALLALLARFIMRKKLKVVFENVDIQPIFLAKSWKGKVFRVMERWALKKCDLLVTSSPIFVSEYFQNVQHYTKTPFLLENKVYPSTNIATEIPSRALQKPIRIGYFGGFRCARSWELIKSLAAQFPNEVHFYLRGFPTLLDKDLFFKELPNFPNIEYGGIFQFPDDLPELYANLDLVWCFDFYAADSNSKWLLPTRLYDGGLFHIPMLGEKGTATGNYISEKQIGWTFYEPMLENLAHFLANLNNEMYQKVRTSYATLDRNHFAGEADYAKLVAYLRTHSNHSNIFSEFEE